MLIRQSISKLWKPAKCVWFQRFAAFAVIDENKLREQYHITQEKLNRLKQGFKNFDINNDGVITRNEFKMAANNLGLKQFAVQQMEAWFQKIDLDGSGEITFDEYVHLMQEEPSGWLGMVFSDPKSMVEFCFQTFDKFNEGYLNTNQVRDLIRYIRGTATDNDLKEFLALAKPKKEGRLTKPELLTIFVKEYKH